MRNVYILVLFFVILASCVRYNNQRNDFKITQIATQPVTITDSFKLNELINPQSIKFYDNWIIAINLANSNNIKPFYFYDKDNFKLDFTLGGFGKGPKEFTDINPYYFIKTDTGFYVNGNNYFEYQFNKKNDSLIFKFKQKKPIAFVSLNNIIKINDSIYIFKSFAKDKQFIMYNSNQKKEVNRFGAYPSINTVFKDFDDKRNFFEATMVKQPSGSKLAVFFQSIPQISYYDTHGNLIKNIFIKECYSKCKSVEDFYQESCKFFFASPCERNQGIYVLFYNKTGPEMMKRGRETIIELQKWNWKGKLVKRYLLKNNFNCFTISDDGKELFLLSVNPNNNTIYKAILN